MAKEIQKNKNVDIFIYSHIPFHPVAVDPIFKVLTNNHEPDEKFRTKLEIYRDYDGEDNISDNNLMYNEYSGFYWIWKNYPIKEYVGMNHYRRMYMNYGFMPDIDQIFKSGKKIILNNPIPLRVHDKLPREGEILSNRDWYEYWHNINDFNLLGEIIQDIYPEYMDGFERMSKATYLYPSSMFIMDKKTFNEYCEFIFTILDEFNKRRNCFNSDDYREYVHKHHDEYVKPYLLYYTEEMQSRIIGYIAERALATFLMHGGKNSLESKAEIFQWGMIPENAYKI